MCDRFLYSENIKVHVHQSSSIDQVSSIFIILVWRILSGMLVRVIYLISKMIFGVLLNAFLFWRVCLYMKGLLLCPRWFRVAMTPLGNCLRIYCIILNFKLCIIWLLLIFLIVHIRNLRIMIFLIRRQSEISSLPITPVFGAKSFGLILSPC